MAKKANEQAPQKLNSLRVRWVEVEVNGSDTTIEEALRTIERIRRPAIEVSAPLNRIPQIEMPASGSSRDSNASPPEDAELIHPVVAADESLNDSSEENSSVNDLNRKKRGEGDKKDRNARIKPVGDIDFVPEDKQTLKECFALKLPSSDMDQILVICNFLQNILQVPKIGPGHILSGFKHVGKPIPKDLKQTLRNMKDKKAWINYNDIENIRLTTEGDNRVEHHLGKADNGAK